MKKLFPALIVLAGLLAACGNTAAVTRPPTVTPIPPTATSLPTATTVPTSAASPTPAPTFTPFPTGCQATSLLPEPFPGIPEVTANDWVLGPSNAPVTLIEYGDFQCTACATFFHTLKKVLAANPKDVRLVFRFFPQANLYDKALTAAQAAEAAGLQGKFWEMHDALFDNQNTWNLMAMNDFVAWLSEQAKTLGVDVTRFDNDLVDAAVVNTVQDAQRSAEALNLPGTPFVLMNGLYAGQQLDEATLTYVASMLKNVSALESRRVSACPPVTIDKSKQYIATLNTNRGDIVIQLYPDKAPLAVNSFVFLAQRGWFDGVPFHRVVTDFVAQSGDPSGTGLGNPGYYFVTEHSDLKFDKAGMVGMANSGQNSNGSQFFITLSPQPGLDGSYTVFGQVIQGMDVVQKLTPRNPQPGAVLPEPDLINKVSIEVK